MRDAFATRRLYAISLTAFAVTAGAIGLALNLTLVPARYDWLGILHLTLELFSRTGAWCIALMWWLLGAGHRAGWHVSLGRKDLPHMLALLCWTLAATMILRIAGERVPVATPADLICLSVLLAVIARNFVGAGASGSLTSSEVGTRALIGGAVFAGFSLITYGHTMIKASVFVVADPRDEALFVSDLAIMGADYYNALARWRLQNPALTRSLDVVYVGFLQQLGWSIFYFMGSRDTESARIYGLALFVVFFSAPLLTMRFLR